MSQGVAAVGDHHRQISQHPAGQMSRRSGLIGVNSASVHPATKPVSTVCSRSNATPPRDTRPSPSAVTLGRL